jgi:hypothetical protein
MTDPRLMHEEPQETKPAILAPTAQLDYKRDTLKM